MVALEERGRRPRTTDPPHQLASRRELLDHADVLVVGDVGVATGVDGDVERVQELPGRGSAAPELAEETPGRSEHLNTRITVVGDIHEAVGTDRDLAVDVLGIRRILWRELKSARSSSGPTPATNHG